MIVKQAVILHGTDGQPESNWFPWLKGKLEAEGYRVWVPLLPNNHTPNWWTYNEFLLGPDAPDLTSAVVVGHSSGAVEILNLLMDERCPRIKLGLMVSAWAHGTPAGMDDDQFAGLFPKGGFDFEKIKMKAELLASVHSADDPYCPLDQAEYLTRELDAPLTVLQDARHIGGNFTELPAAWEIIERAALV